MSPSSSLSPPSKPCTFSCAAVYVFSGICQPLLMTPLKEAGLASNTAQLYMFFYYLGPALVILTLVGGRRQPHEGWGSVKNAAAASATIALFDIVAAAMNYTGASLAGPTVFAIIYSSVTIWTAIWSRIFLKRTISTGQWVAILAVFGGLCITATDSVRLGPGVLRGTVLVMVGSMLHGTTYVLNEAIMTVTDQTLSISQNTAVQGATAAFVTGIWELTYTLPRWDDLIGNPMREAHTSLLLAASILGAFMVANLIHSVSYYHTLKYYAGGATSAGIMKGLQAVLVSLAAHVLYCGRVGGDEMCFSSAKFVSLVTVSGGVALFGYLAEQQQQHHQPVQSRNVGYMTIHGSSDDGDEDSIDSREMIEVEELHGEGRTVSTNEKWGSQHSYTS